MKSIIVKIGLGIIAILLFFGSFTIVPAGHTGVRITLGSVSTQPLGEGLHFKIPLIQGIEKMDNRIQRVDKEVAAASKDLQTVHGLIVVNYKLVNAKSAEVYKNIGSGYSEILIAPAIQEKVKAITAHYTAEELITKREEVSIEMYKLLDERLSPYGLIITSFNIANFNFSEEFNKAIEQKQTAQQLALKAQQDLQRIKIEAEQTVAQAQAQAESYRLQKQEITDSLIKYEAIKKWNGQLPQYVTNGDSIFNIPLK